MALDTYSALQTAVALHLNRAGDTAITTPLPDLITLFESRVKRKVRVKEMLVRSTASTTANSQYLDLPASPDAFLEMRDLKLNTSPTQQLEFMAPGQFWRIYASSTTGQPKAFTLTGTQIAFGPIPDSAYTVEMLFYQFDALSGTNTSNWLLSSYPDLYLYGTLTEAEPFLGNDTRMPVWKSRVEEALAELAAADWRSDWGAGPLRMMVEHGNP